MYKRQVLERRRNYAAELVPHKGPAVKGNVVHMDFEGLLDGVAFAGGTAKDQSVQLGSGRMIPGFEDGILGHKAGDEFEINVTFPKNYPNKELAGKPVVFKIKLHDVCVRQLPALNSDFAKKMGKETMEEYRAFVKQQLFDGRHGGALNHAKDQILGQLAERAEKTKKTVEEIKAGTDVAALRRNEGIRKAADWVIDHSTIEEKVESK